MEYEGRGNSGDSGSFCPESFLSESGRLSNRTVNRLEEAGILTQGELAEFLLSHDMEDLHGLGRNASLSLRNSSVLFSEDLSSYYRIRKMLIIL